MTKQRQLIEAVTYALQGLSSQTRVSLLTKIVDYLPQDFKKEVLQKALALIEFMFSSGSDGLNALKSIAHKLPPELLPKAFAISKAIKSSGLARTEAIETLVPVLPPELLLEALDIARDSNLNSEYTTALALSALADKLPEELQTEVALEALAAADSILLTGEHYFDRYRSYALTAVADVVPETLRAEVLQKALTAARSAEEGWARSMSLSNLVSKLPEALQAEVLQEALYAARDEVECRGGYNFLAPLMVLVPQLLPELLPEALTIARDIQLERERATALIIIAARLPKMLPETFALFKNTRYNFKLIRDTASNLPSELLLEAFDIAKDIQSESDRVTALIALASRMSKMPKDELLPLWQTIRHWLSQQSRQEFARCALALTAVIHAIGGQSAVVEALMEIQDVERWQQ